MMEKKEIRRCANIYFLPAILLQLGAFAVVTDYVSGRLCFY